MQRTFEDQGRLRQRGAGYGTSVGYNSNGGALHSNYPPPRDPNYYQAPVPQFQMSGMEQHSGPASYQSYQHQPQQTYQQPQPTYSQQSASDGYNSYQSYSSSSKHVFDMGAMSGTPDKYTKNKQHRAGSTKTVYMIVGGIVGLVILFSFIWWMSANPKPSTEQLNEFRRPSSTSPDQTVYRRGARPNPRSEPTIVSGGDSQDKHREQDERRERDAQRDEELRQAQSEQQQRADERSEMKVEQPADDSKWQSLDGHYIHGGQDIGRTMTDLNECRKKCLEDEKCVGVTMYKVTGHCNMKAHTKVSVHSDWYTEIKIENKVKEDWIVIPDTYIGGQTGNIKNAKGKKVYYDLETCRRACQEVAECVAITQNEQSGQCFLKGEIDIHAHPHWNTEVLEKHRGRIPESVRPRRR